MSTATQTRTATLMTHAATSSAMVILSYSIRQADAPQCCDRDRPCRVLDLGSGRSGPTLRQPTRVDSWASGRRRLLVRACTVRRSGHGQALPIGSRDARDRCSRARLLCLADGQRCAGGWDTCRHRRGSTWGNLGRNRRPTGWSFSTSGPRS
jgi:hypothetical protein